MKKLKIIVLAFLCSGCAKCYDCECETQSQGVIIRNEYWETCNESEMKKMEIERGCKCTKQTTFSI